MLRDLVRNYVFERFPLFAGVCLGWAQTALVAWACAWWGGLRALPLLPLLALGVALAAANGALMPRVGLGRPRRRALALLEQAYLALGFATIVVAGAIVAVTLGFAIAVPLLAFVHVPAASAVAVYHGASALGAVAVLGALAHGYWVAPRRLEVTRIRVEVAGLDASLGGLRIVQLSDFHIGNGIDARRLDEIVARANALEPDLVALTGDLFDHDPRWLELGAAGLSKLRARLGVFAVLGNHDWMTGLDAVADALARHAPSVRLLRDEAVALATPAPLHLAGAEDPGRDWTLHGHGLPAIDRLAAALPDSEPRILLLHRPDGFPQAAASGFDLVLSGHFHGGQLALPIAGGAWNAARLLSPFHRGLYRIASSSLYVTRGLGFTGPRLRFGSDPEIACLTLEAAPRQA